MVSKIEMFSIARFLTSGVYSDYVDVELSLIFSGCDSNTKLGRAWNRVNEKKLDYLLSISSIIDFFNLKFRKHL